MILGDNLFIGEGLKQHLADAVQRAENGRGATVFGYPVEDPERFGVVEFDACGRAVSIEEKPAHPKSNYCVTGLYFYDQLVTEYARSLKPSERGELEITDLNRFYLKEGRLHAELLEQGITWLDTGTHESLADAGELVRELERQQNHKLGCPEEIAWRNGWIDTEKLRRHSELFRNNPYGQYLRRLSEEGGRER